MTDMGDPPAAHIVRCRFFLQHIFHRFSIAKTPIFTAGVRFTCRFCLYSFPFSVVGLREKHFFVESYTQKCSRMHLTCSLIIF